MIGFRKSAFILAAAAIPAAALFDIVGVNKIIDAVFGNASAFAPASINTIKPIAYISLSHLFSVPAYCESGDKPLNPMNGSGCRIQIAAVGYEAEAKAIVRQIEEKFPLKAHIRFEIDSWKVRVGDFKEESEARKMCARLQQTGYPDAFIVDNPLALSTTGYRVQISAHKTLEAAERTAAIIKEELQFETYVIAADKHWKVRVGDFLDSAGAEAAKTKLIDFGFDDAFIVEDNINH